MMFDRTFPTGLTRIVLPDGSDLDISGAEEVTILGGSSLQITWAKGGRVGNGTHTVVLAPGEWRRLTFNEPEVGE